MRIPQALFLLLLTVAFAPAEAQFSRHMIFFRDKQSNSFSTANPQAFLSQRATARRTRQGLGYDSTDLPVTGRYVDSVRRQGAVQVLSTSKWLNAVLIVCSDSATLQRIRALPFVAGQQALAQRSSAATKPKRIAGNGQAPLTLARRGQADLFSYGASANQVQIHQGQWLHNQGFQGQGIQIAVQDAGFDRWRTTPVLDSARLQGRILGERDFVAFDGTTNEDDAHGRECLTTIGALSNGVMVGTAPKASFWMLRTENAFSEQPIEMFNWVVGAEFADSAGADMISSSLGYYNFDDARFDYSYANFYRNNTLVTRGATLAVKKGMIVMNSAGNEGQTPWKYLVFPADADSVCAVGAITANGNIAGFSSFGYPGKVKPNVVSIGLNTTVAGPNGVYTNSGTSFSNPNMAGLVACLWQAFPNAKNMEILDALYRSADRFATPTDRFGFGLPNMRVAWRILKTKENLALYGNDWLRANPAIFNDTLRVTYVGQTEGVATLRLIHESGRTVRQWTRASEPQMVYDTLLNNLSSEPAGNYTLTYNDGIAGKSLPLRKLTGPSLNFSGPTVMPNPSTDAIRIYLPNGSTDGIELMQVTDAQGRLLFTYSGSTVGSITSYYTIAGSAGWPAGVYAIRMVYGGKEHNIKAVKL